MADVDPKAPSSRRRTHRSGEPTPQSGAVDERAETDVEASSRVGPGFIARRAATLVAKLSGRRPERVISIDRKDDEWCVGVEVVEVSRIPDSADILAVYDVRLNTDGDLISFRRTRRYARGQLDCERRR